MKAESLYIQKLTYDENTGNEIIGLFPSEDNPAIVSSYTYDAKRMGGAPTITATIYSSEPLQWKKEEFVEYNGDRFFASYTPNSTKDNSSRMWKSEITFSSRRELLDNTLFFDVVVDNVDTQNKDRYRSNQTKFTFGGTIYEFVARINSSMAYCGLYRPTDEYKGYYVVVDEGYGTDEVKEVSFEDQYLTDVLQLINTTFELDYYWDGNVCHVGKVQHDLTDTPIKYGCSDALISVSKENANYKIVDMITGYGSSDNLPYYYPNDDEFGEAVFDTENISKNNVSVDLSKLQNTFGAGNEYNKKFVLSRLSTSEFSKLFVVKRNVSEKGQAYDDDPTKRGDSGELQISAKFLCLANCKIDLSNLQVNTSFDGDSGISCDFSSLRFEIVKNGIAEIKNSLDNKFVCDQDGIYEFRAYTTYQFYCGTRLPEGVDFYNGIAYLSLDGNVTISYQGDGSDYVCTEDGSIQVKTSECGILFQNTTDSMYATISLVEYISQEEGIDGGVKMSTIENTEHAASVIVTDRIWLYPSSVLLPSIYRKTGGAERFYYALNNTHKLPSGSGYYEFLNLYKKGNPHQGTVTFDDIKPTINGIVNAEGQLFGEIADVAFDKDDSDVKDSDGKYIHNYFYIKLHKFNGEFGFDLFNHVLAKEPAKINLIKSNGCPACSFVINNQPSADNSKCYNCVSVDENGNLKQVRTDKNDYIFANASDAYEDKLNQDSTQKELWIAVQKDTSTLGIIMPNASAGFKPQKGDLFVITGIKPPKVLVTAAEKRLDDALIKYMSENNTDQFNYSVKFSRIFLQENPEFASKLNENAKLSIQIQGDSDRDGNLISHEVFVSNYSVKVDNDELEEVEIELVNSLEVTKSDTKQIIDAVKGETVKSLSSMVGGSNTNSFNASITDKMYISKLKDDTAKGTITWEKIQKLVSGLLVGNQAGSWDIDSDGYSHLITNFLKVSKAAKVGDKFVFDTEKAFKFDADGNIIAHSIASENSNVDEEKGFAIAVKDEETGQYKLCIDELLAWGLATVKQLHVKGDSTFDGNLFSKQFISDFLTGKGWGIYNKPITNAAGMQENKWTGEFDNVIVRGSLRVYEMIISQLLGENDNRVFTGMMEVDHYDPDSGKVYLDTQDGKLYNPFRRNDIIMVQRFNGMPNSSNDYYVTKNYELLVTDAGCGSLEDGDKRLDWITFTNFASSMADASPEKLIKKKDTFVRVDNLGDPDRKGIMQIITVGTATPHLDVIYGLKTDPEGALKGRLGNLEGIVHPWFGRLQGFGEYLNNLYAVGDLILRRTGESVDTKFQVLENMFSTRFAKTSYELTNGQNYLDNGQFLEQITDAETPIIASWEINTDDETMFWVDATGMPFMVNSMLTTSGNKKVTLEQNDGRQMLRIQNCGLRQKNAIIKQPGTHKEYVKGSGEKNDAGLSQTEASAIDVQDKLYVNVRLYAKTAGQLAYGFEGCTAVDGKVNTLTAKTENIAYSGEWQTVKMEGKWNGTGDFIIRYSGDCYIALVTITDEPLSEFSKTVSTQIVQTAENIKLLGENIDKVNGRTTNLGIELNTEKGEIRQYVNTVDKKNREDTSSLITQTAQSITSVVEKNKQDADGNFTSVRTSIKQNADSITSIAKQVNNNGTSITQIQQNINTITQTVGKAATQEQLTANVNTLKKSISDNIDAAKSYAREQANDVGTGIRNDYASTITIVQQKSDSWSVAAGGFDSNGNLKASAGAVLKADFAGIFATEFANNGGVVKSEISAFVTKDSVGNMISNAKISADNIVLTGHQMNFTGDQITIDTNNFKLDKRGNVSVKGEINATSGSIAGFNINKNSIGSIGQAEGMSLSNEYLQFMNHEYLYGEGYFIACGNYLGTGLRINSVTSAYNDLSTGIRILIEAGTSTPSGKMCTALDLFTRWADQAGSFDMTNPYEGNHAIVIRGGDVIGLRPSFVRLAASDSLTEYHHTVECYNTSAITLDLPSPPKYGQCYTIIQRGSRVTFSSDNGIYDVRRASSATTWYSDTRGQVSWLWYNGSQWIVCYTTN